jgi:hypothetical protein
MGSFGCEGCVPFGPDPGVKSVRALYDMAADSIGV